MERYAVTDTTLISIWRVDPHFSCLIQGIGEGEQVG